MVHSLVSGIVAVLVLIVIFTLTNAGYWPHATCHSIQPFGHHDYTCTYWIGR